MRSFTKMISDILPQHGIQNLGALGATELFELRKLAYLNRKGIISSYNHTLVEGYVSQLTEKQRVEFLLDVVNFEFSTFETKFTILKLMENELDQSELMKKVHSLVLWINLLRDEKVLKKTILSPNLKQIFLKKKKERLEVI